MAKLVTTVVQQTISGDNFTGQGPIFSESLANATGVPPGSFTLAAGFNSIPVPAAALGVVIVPPPGSANTKTLKGITGDTGIPIDPAHSTKLTFTAAQNATIGITSGGIEILTLLWQ